MDKLSFSSTLYSTAGFKAVAAFDNYFSFSGRRYKVIQACSIKGEPGYQVERLKISQNIPLNILKVISFMTLIIPLIMGIGKFLLRTRYNFLLKKQLCHPLIWLKHLLN
ncbi:MAG: DUF648 domain-containing protein [Parachlamydiaceae bacterium]|nr:MAG: DUF648 domain-containing protein [Parachlamydiaceae bacterium]